ncbi:hypothetical protein DY000_02040098 [Brassica cretica]|uniref:Uncharacterized protein n=1 Tax=Brassica cretica TaxID=69181 RepID=A0ABQ7BRJ1_BRACR|nr:hypothetical protein DY000_02040098 [Brassica cretica]
MSSSQNEKKNSDIEMGEASPVLPIPAFHEATPNFVARFLSFNERLSRRSAEKKTNRTSAETSAIPSSSALPISAKGNKSLSDAAPLVGTDTTPVQVPEVLAQPSGSSTTPVLIPEKGQAMESMPPPLGFLRLLPLCYPKVAKGMAPQPRPPRRGDVPKFISLIDGMISDCGSEVGRLTEGLAESPEALKRIEATLKSTEDTHTAETSQLEVQVSGLERAKSSQEEPRTREPAGHARLTRMAVLFDSLVAVRKKDLALAGIEGGLSEIQLLKGEAVPTLDSEEAMLLSHKEELMASKGDFDSILSLLKSECTLTPCLEETEGQGRADEEGEGDAVERGDGEVAEGGDGDAVPSSDEVEDEGGAPRSA